MRDLRTVHCWLFALTVMQSVFARGYVAGFQSPLARTAALGRRNPLAVASLDHLLSTQCDATTRSDQTADPNNVVMDPLVVCGPSGVGKSSLIRRYMETYSSNWGFSVSHTTRQPRPGEVDGVDYTFCERGAMENLIEQEVFLEWANVHGNLYGTSWESVKAVQREGKRCLLDIDVQGVQELKNLQNVRADWIPKYLFVAPPTMDALRARLTSRNTETPETLAMRLSQAQTEVDYGLGQGTFDAVVVNDDLEQAVRDFEAAIERLYPSHT